MLRLFKTIIFFLLLSGITFLLNFRQDVNETISVNSNKIIDAWIINIPKIKLKEIVYLSSIRDSQINGIVLFEEYGRPDEKYSNTIIGAHSGTGSNAYFNDIDKLVAGDRVIVYHRCVHFTYEVVKKYQVDETDLSPLNKVKSKTLLTLLTCNRNNSKKRIVVMAEQL